MYVYIYTVYMHVMNVLAFKKSLNLSADISPTSLKVIGFTSQSIGVALTLCQRTHLLYMKIMLCYIQNDFTIIFFQENVHLHMALDE